MRSEFYLDERQRKKRRRLLKLKIYGGVVAFFMLIIGAGYLIVYSSVFQIKNIEVIGNKNVGTEEIINGVKKAISEQSKIASFLTTNNILVWKTEPNLFQKINPRIAKINIEKDYIERQVKVNVQERERFGIWCLLSSLEDNASTTEADSTLLSSMGEGCWWFDKQGVIFFGAPSAEGNLINKVDDFSGRSLNTGDSVLEEGFLTNLIKIFETLEKSDLRIKSLKLENLQLQEIIANPSTGLGQANSLPQIYFSLRIDPAFALAALNSLEDSDLSKIEYIDLRVENRAYYKLK